MRYYKNKNNEIFAYDNEQIKQGYGKDLTAISEDEAMAIANPPKTVEELEQIRINAINQKARDIIISKYSIEKQSSAQLGIYGDEYLATMKAFIKQVIDISNESITNGTPADEIAWGIEEVTNG